MQITFRFNSPPNAHQLELNLAVFKSGLSLILKNNLDLKISFAGT